MARASTGEGRAPVPARRSDAELVAAFQSSGSRDAVDELLRRHEGLVVSVARGYFVPGGDDEDVRQQAMIGFWKAVRDFADDAGCAFTTFARTCMQRQVVTAVRAATRHKHTPLTDAERIGPVDRDGDRPPVRPSATHLPTAGHEDAAVTRLTIDDSGGMPFGLTEIEALIERHGHDAVHDLVRAHFAGRPARRSRGDDPAQLSENEAHVLVGLLSGKRYQEIADDLARTPKFVDNTVQRLRGKLRHLLES